MHEKADLREARDDSRALQNASRRRTPRGEPQRGFFAAALTFLLRRLPRAASDIATTSDVTP